MIGYEISSRTMNLQCFLVSDLVSCLGVKIMYHMPTVLVEFIMEFMNQHDLVQIAYTCKEWSRLDVLPVQITLNNWVQIKRLNHCVEKKNKETRNKVKKIQFDPDLSGNFLVPEYAIKCATKLRKLSEKLTHINSFFFKNVRDFTAFEELFSSSAFRQLPLNCLTFENCYSMHVIIELLSNHKFTSIKFNECSIIIHRLLNFVSSFSSLKNLYLCLQNQLVETLAPLSELTNLTMLTITDFNYALDENKENAFTFISKLSSLKYLKAYRSRMFRLLVNGMNNASISELDISFSQICNLTLNQLSRISIPLEKLNLRGNDGITDENLSCLKAFSSTLRRLNVSSCKGISFKGFIHLKCISFTEIWPPMPRRNSPNGRKIKELFPKVKIQYN